METLVKRGLDQKDSEQYKFIKGWGIDADNSNYPNYPMKHYTGADYQRIHYAKPQQQPVNVEVLHSNERPTITSVFGTSTPPRGLSGALRRYAFKFSEGSAAHWMTLILADRVNAVEGIVDDLASGHVPNIFKERGWNAEWKYNKAGVIKNVAIGVAVTSAIVTFLIVSKNRNKRIEGIH
jgi:tetrahydromethanopterin S-methyltransferase subunit B